MKRVFIVGGLRSHFGVKNGIFRQVRPEILGAKVVQALLERYHGGTPDLLICGNAVGPGGNLGRLLALEAGLPEDVPALTVDLQCASGLAAIDLGAAKIRSGDCRTVLAGGAESASLQPERKYPDNDERSRLRDPVFTAAQFIPREFSDDAMLLGAERAARAYGITREEADRAALLSQRRAGRCAEEGLLRSVIIPLFGSTKDEAIRSRMSEKLLARAPRVTHFEGGILTAANACTMNDGAAFLLLADERWIRERGLVPKAEILGTELCGGDPLRPPLSADRAVSCLLRRKGLSYEDIDAFEYNEAFAVISAHFRKMHPEAAERLNRWGGALAYGHPYGASGAEIMIHLTEILHHDGGDLGVAAIPAAGGVGSAVLIRRVDRQEWLSSYFFTEKKEMPVPAEAWREIF